MNKITHRTLLSALALMSLASITATAATSPEVLATSAFESAREASGRHTGLQLFTVIPAERATKHTGTATARGDGEKAATRPAQSAYCCSHYIYEGYTELFDDLDYDGFYTYLRINVDIDTDHYESDIYIKAFLRSGIGAWKKIYESNVFTLFGSSAFDDYEIEAELVSGFTPDYYDVLVEVYDAYTGELLVEYGDFENASFSALPMEDVNRDGAIALPVVTAHGTSGGGSLSIPLLLIAALAGWRRSKRWQQVMD